MAKTKSQHQAPKLTKRVIANQATLKSEHHRYKIRSQAMILGIIGGIFLIALGIAIVFMIISNTSAPKTQHPDNQNQATVRQI